MRLFWIYNRNFDSHNKESNLSKLNSSQTRNSPLLKSMKLSNTSTALNLTSEMPLNLGWGEMTSFPAAALEPEIELGWKSMPEFGRSTVAAWNVEAVADFVRESRPVSAQAGLTSFWSAMSMVA